MVQKLTTNKKDNFTPIKNSIQPTLESLQTSQINDYFEDELFTKLIENIRIISLNINGLDLGKGEYSLPQLCSNLQDKGEYLLCLTETNINWHRQYPRTNVCCYSKNNMAQTKQLLCTSDASLQWNRNYKPRVTAIISLGNISSAIITKGEDSHELGRWNTVTMLGTYNKRTSVFNMYRPENIIIENSNPITVIKQQ